MDDELTKSIKSCKIFASIDPNSDVFQALVAQFKTVKLKSGEVVFSQGDPSHALFILVSGKLAAILSVGDAKPKIVGHILPIEPVGEMGALSGDPRSLTLKAIEDSQLLKLPSETFKKLCRQYPSIMYETLHPVVGRSQQLIQLISTGEKRKHIALIPANADVHLAKFEEKLIETVKRYKKVILLSETTIRSEDDKDTRNFEELINNIEADNIIVIYLLKSYETPLAKACWDRIGKVFIVAEGNVKPHLDTFALDKLHNSRHLIEVRRELILLYKKGAIPNNTHEWLYKADFFLHHHIRQDYLPDFQRLLRFIRGKPFGLVLSGGGAKGWAHIGALRALLESHIPIDAIGGVSAGAVIGGLYALNYSYEETYQLFEALLGSAHNIFSWKNFCWPAISLFSCEEFTLETEKVFGNKKIENMWLPYFAVTCNLGAYREATHKSGLLWEKCRATVAVPGLVPPMVINGELHIDGGVVNNLPVNTMRDLLGSESKIVAIELMSEVVDQTRYNFPPTLTFKQAMLAKMRLGYRDYKFPPFLETFIRSLLVGSSARQKENSALADLLIVPDTRGYSMLRVNNRDEQNSLIDLGYQTAFEKISTWDVKK
ncbi:MAG: patatin-like phospholipase family protein [Pseudomonadota bacterium]